MDTQSPEHTHTAPTTRRTLLASLIAAGAGIAVAGRASAAEEPAPTTTAAPSRSDADTATLNSLLAREADMVATYAVAVAGSSGDDAAALALIESHHVAYVQAIEGYLGGDAVKTAGTALPLTAGSYASVAPQLAAHEDATAQTHIAALATLQGIDAAALVASIVVPEARHGAALRVSSTGDVRSAAGN